MSMDGANRSGRLPTQFRVTREDVARAAGVTLAALYKAEQRGVVRVLLPGRGRHRRLDLESVLAYVARVRGRRATAAGSSPR